MVHSKCELSEIKNSNTISDSILWRFSAGYYLCPFSCLISNIDFPMFGIPEISALFNLLIIPTNEKLKIGPSHCGRGRICGLGRYSSMSSGSFWLLAETQFQYSWRKAGQVAQERYLLGFRCCCFHVDILNSPFEFSFCGFVFLLLFWILEPFISTSLEKESYESFYFSKSQLAYYHYP